MSLKKILIKGTTRMSLHERFTFLRCQSAAEPTTSPVHITTVHQGLFRDQQASLKNRRLAQMMDRRPTVMAALKLKKRILKQRLGQLQGRVGLSVKDRLSLRGRGRGGVQDRVGARARLAPRTPAIMRLNTSPRARRGLRGNLSRSQSMTNLSRSQSMQSLNRRHYNADTRGARGGRYQNRSPSFRRQEYWRGGGGGGGGRGRGLRTRGGGFNRNRDDFQNQRGGGRFNNRNQRSRGFRGRSSGRGSRGGRGRGGRGPPPSREELDCQLDQYMSSHHDQQESWD